MKNPMWIGGEFSEYEIGQSGFLVEIYDTNRRSDVFELRDYPPRTNVSGEPVLDGWCGETNNVSVNGHGYWEVIKLAKTGRALIRQVKGERLQAALEELGYPDLYEEAA